MTMIGTPLGRAGRALARPFATSADRRPLAIAVTGVLVAPFGFASLVLLLVFPVLMALGSGRLSFSLDEVPAVSGVLTGATSGLGVAAVGLALTLGVAAADRELMWRLVDPTTSRSWRRRPWTWRRLLLVPVDPATWRRVWWLGVRSLTGLVTVLCCWGGAAGVLALVRAPFRQLTPVTALAPLAGGAVAFALVAACRGIGRLQGVVAGELLGPSPTDRIEALTDRALGLTERARLARDLHDSLGHTVTVVALQAAAARKVLDDDPVFVAQALAVIEDSGRRAAGELADVLRLLRADAPTGSSNDLDAPGVDRLDRLVDCVRTAGLPVTLRTQGPLSAVPDDVGRVAYRVVQEGCTNVMRHARGAATEVTVQVEPRSVDVRVRNGPGRRGDVTSTGLGLRGLRGRVEELGGALEAGDVDGGGFVLAARLPIGVGA